VTLVVLLVVSTVLAIFFVFFTACMAWDQYQGLTTNVTGVEFMKSWDEEPRSVAEGLVDTCGEPFSLLWWLLPVSPPLRSSAHYEWTPEDDPDAYDKRDPLIQKFFRNWEKAIARQAAQLEEERRLQEEAAAGPAEPAAPAAEEGAPEAAPVEAAAEAPKPAKGVRQRANRGHA
jgi:hypothetical protein